MDSYVLLAEISPRDPQSGPVTLRLSSARGDARGVVLNGATWLPLLIQAPTISRRFVAADGRVSLNIEYGSIAFRFSTEIGNDSWGEYVFDGAPIKIFRGKLGDDFASYTLELTGRCGPLERPEVGVGVISLRGLEGDLETEFLTETYAGTGGAEGPIDFIGRPKPFIGGRVENFDLSGHLIDPVNLIYQVHGHGPIQAIDAVYEQAISLDAPVANVANYAALVALSLLPGQWATCTAEGLVRLGGQSSFKLTCDVRGALDGSTYVSKPFALASLFLKRIPGVSIDTAKAAELDAAFPHDWGCYVTSQVSVREMVEQVLGDAGALLLPMPNGQWSFCLWDATKTPTVLSSKGDSYPLVRAYRQKGAFAPVWSVKVGGRKCWSVHSTTEISPLLRDALAKIATVATGATKNTMTRSATAPSSPTDGDVWVDTSVTPNVTRVRVGGAWQAGSNLVTQGTHIGVENGATVGAPVGTNVAGVAAATVAAVASNFNGRNDRLSTAITAPSAGAITSTFNTDGTATLTLPWTWAGTEADIDGFIAYLYDASTNGAYAISGGGTEQKYVVPAASRSVVVRGMPSDRYYTWGVHAYRVVDKDVNAIGVVYSTVSQAGPVRPTTTPVFGGTIDNSALIAGTTASALNSAAAQGKALDDAVGDNNKLSKAEKRRIVPKVDALAAEVPTLVANGNTLGCTTEAAALTAAWSGASGFLTYLQSLGGSSPNYAYRDYSTNTAMSGATYEARITALNVAMANLSAAVKTKAATLASWSGVTGTGRPADYATVGATWGVNIGSQPTALGHINSSEGSKLGGIESGATVGARAGVNFYRSDGTWIGPENADNRYLTTLPNGALYNPTAGWSGGGNTYLQSNGRQGSVAFTSGFLTGGAVQISGITYDNTSYTNAFAVNAFYVNFGAGYEYFGGQWTYGADYYSRYYVWLVAPNVSVSGAFIHASTDYYNTSYQFDRVYLGSVAMPGAGGSSGGPGAGSGGSWCVDPSSYLIADLLAGEAAAGSPVDLLSTDYTAVEPSKIAATALALAECVKLHTPSGARLVVSECTPIERRDGSDFRAADALGEEVAVMVGDRLVWERVTEVEPMPGLMGDGSRMRPVVRINAGSRVFFAGEELGRRIATHNYNKP